MNIPSIADNTISSQDILDLESQLCELKIANDNSINLMKLLASDFFSEPYDEIDVSSDYALSYFCRNYKYIYSLAHTIIGIMLDIGQHINSVEEIYKRLS